MSGGSQSMGSQSPHRMTNFLFYHISHYLLFPSYSFITFYLSILFMVDNLGELQYLTVGEPMLEQLSL